MIDLILLRSALRDTVRPRRLLIALLLIGFPAAIALLWRTFARDFPATEAYNILSASLIFGFILTILSVIYGTGVVSQEIEEKTIVYLLTRPVPRWRILLAKFFASLIAILVTILLSAVLLAAVVHGPTKIASPQVLRDLRILSVGALTYGSLFLLLATLLARPLIWGLLLAFGWESWVPNMPGSFPKLSIMAYLRVLAPHRLQKAEGGDDAQEFIASFLPPADITASQAWTVLLVVTALALGGALLAFSRREYAPRDDTE